MFLSIWSGYCNLILLQKSYNIVTCYEGKSRLISMMVFFKKHLFSPPIGTLSDSSNDGAWLCHDCRNSPVLLWLCHSSATVGKDCGYISPVFRAVVITTSLWLWNESREVSAHRSWESKGKKLKWLLTHSFPVYKSQDHVSSQELH